MNQNKRGPCLGLQRATPACAGSAASRLIGEPMSGADAVRAMTGTKVPNATKLGNAFRNLQASLNALQEAKDLVELRVQQWAEVIDQEFEGLTP